LDYDFGRYFIFQKIIGRIGRHNHFGATILLVASMSWLDPEITPLVPVLKSYWLTIHVSLEAGSYGFLLLGAVVGMLNLLLMIFANSNNKRKYPQNHQRINRYQRNYFAEWISHD
jgi:ABC-type transport system involved in cytochrome c biogenesis permease subunit